MQPLDIKALPQQLRSHSLEILRVYWVLVKVMLPAILLVKLLDSFGATQWLSWLLSPLMELVGLPASIGLVWAAAILTNLYTAMVVFYELAGGESLSVAQVSVLGILILVAHSLPTEGAVAKLVGVRWRVTLMLRIGGALTLAALTHQIYSWGNWQQQPAIMLWQPEAQAESLAAWAIDQLWLFATIFLIISALMTLLRLLRWLGIEKLMHWLLSPLLRVLQVGREATHVTIIGITLGLSFGAGLLIAEARSGEISRRDMILTICFLGLAHSLIEDTLLILLLGADLYSILWGRLAFAIVVMAVIARCWRRTSVAESPSAERVLDQ
ncbi:hypothetical protein MIB92_06460 [Aestuariirhabdus sp. Z084]|uniref:hypothetical protein n=1 Tax=Aestuariirhabdus haliotis TaxID=2918751 RepID=UPI00201B3C3F|nr:hypothetical protein [Aestuariirhabdus haliotis]MCL6415285.1 hypothetical protein [Aestuariirhabdus haliotis]MCL6419545.1 hypothetical protein [Aestuariirhabdus haliotis]